MPREPLSVVVTTLDNAATLERCLASVAWADEILLLDSGSRDATLEIARRHGARIHSQPFRGYARQKQDAIDRARHAWVLLLDADEALDDTARPAIERALEAPDVVGFRLPRREQVFWTFQHPWTRLNTHLRLFDRRHGAMNGVPVHAAPKVDGPTRTLRDALLLHYGEPDIHTKVAKINAYSTGLVAHKLARRQRLTRLRMLVYPPVFFLRQYFGKRYVLDGWAGFINAAVGAFYVFLKYAKLHEARRAAIPGQARSGSADESADADRATPIVEDDVGLRSG